MIDKAGILTRISDLGEVRIELGCGSRKRDPQAIGVDMLDAAGVDIVGDVFDVLEAFPEGSVQEISSFHFFEHVTDTGALLTAIARALRPGGQLRVVVPHFSNPFFYSDPTHRVYFGLYSFSYFADESIFRRKVPRYGREYGFTLAGARLVFKSYPPNYIRHGLRKMIGWVVNCSTFSKEFYEENLCWLAPCYEIDFVLKRN